MFSCLPREDTAGDRGHSGVTDVNFGEIKVVPDNGDERGRCKCRDEAGKE